MSQLGRCEFLDQRAKVFEHMNDGPKPGTFSGLTDSRLSGVSLDPALQARKTTSDYIAEALRHAIYDGQFSDDEELNQVELAKYFRVSRVPIREALRHLQAEGLVSNIAHRRTIVIGLDREEIAEMIEMRALIEGFLIEKAGPTLDGKSLEQLERLCDEMDVNEQYDQDWAVKNWEFHRALYGPSNLDTAIALVEQFHQKVERYVRLTGNAERRRRASAEHREILAEVVNRDFPAARRRMQDHIMETAGEIKRYYDAREDTASAE